jgi:Tol biopolymer transport system component
MAAAAWFAFVLGARMMRPGSRVMFDVMTDVTPSPLHLALSPDGTRLISVVSTEDRTGLWMRRLDSVSGQLLAPAASIVSTGSFPFWSPDGRFVAYFALDKLNKVDVTGGPAQPLCDVAGGGLGGTWSRNGTILFASGAKDTLFKVPAAGGVAAPVTELDKSRGDLAHRHPKFLPDGNHFVFFVVNQKQEATGVYLGSLDSKETRQLTTSDAMGAFVPPDYLAFVRGSTLMVQHFDLDRLQLTGDPVPAMQEVGINTGNSVGGYTFSDNGVLAIRVGATINERRLRWFDRTGKPLGDVGAIGPHENVALAADGARLAETRPDAAGGDIWIFDLSRNTSTRFTFGTARDDNSIWSPDSNSIVYASARGGVQNLYVKSANGAEQERLLLKSDYSDYPTDWSRDGKYILYTESKNGSDIWVLPLAGDKKPIPFLTTSFFENQARFSSDGRWIAYTSDESGGARQVYVQGFPDKTGKWQVSTSGGTDPHWTKNGREIVYQGVGGIWSVDVDGTGPAFKAGVPKKLFDQSGIGGGPVVTRFAPAADGQRILINLTAQATTATPPIRVVVNWATGLDER